MGMQSLVVFLSEFREDAWYVAGASQNAACCKLNRSWTCHCFFLSPCSLSKTITTPPRFSDAFLCVNSALYEVAFMIPDLFSLCVVRFYLTMAQRGYPTLATFQEEP